MFKGLHVDNKNCYNYCVLQERSKSLQSIPTYKKVPSVLQLQRYCNLPYTNLTGFCCFPNCHKWYSKCKLLGLTSLLPSPLPNFILQRWRKTPKNRPPLRDKIWEWPAWKDLQCLAARGFGIEAVIYHKGILC